MLVTVTFKNACDRGIVTVTVAFKKLLTKSLFWCIIYWMWFATVVADLGKHFANI